MRLLDLTLPTPDGNLALDEALFRRLEAAAETRSDPAELEVLRFWESPQPVVVLGRSSRVDEDVHVAACEEGHVALRRRASGGGTVLVGPGCLCFALVLSYRRYPCLRDVVLSYRFILGRIALALAVPGLAPRGEADLALGDRKVSGSAQLRGRFGVLHQGTMLHAFEPGLIARYLREPRRQPAYRARRPHGAFVRNLPLRASQLRARLAEAWNASPGGPDTAPAAGMHRDARLVIRRTASAFPVGALPLTGLYTDESSHALPERHNPRRPAAAAAASSAATGSVTSQAPST